MLPSSFINEKILIMDARDWNFCLHFIIDIDMAVVVVKYSLKIEKFFSAGKFIEVFSLT